MGYMALVINDFSTRNIIIYKGDKRFKGELNIDTRGGFVVSFRNNTTPPTYHRHFSANIKNPQTNKRSLKNVVLNVDKKTFEFTYLNKFYSKVLTCLSMV